MRTNIKVYFSMLILWWYWLWVFRNKKIYQDLDFGIDNVKIKSKNSYFYKFCYAMAYQPEFRYVFYIRIKRLQVLRFLLFWFFRPNGTVVTTMKDFEIAGGLSFAHGFSIILTATSVGRNCKIFQQTTIGYAHGGVPTIGDNVIIYSGAKVLGPITIGNNAVIGANAVVLEDVPDNGIVVGVPAKLIRYRRPDEKF